jgi:hypothetical protein
MPTRPPAAFITSTMADISGVVLPGLFHSLRSCVPSFQLLNAGPTTVKEPAMSLAPSRNCPSATFLSPRAMLDAAESRTVLRAWKPDRPSWTWFIRLPAPRYARKAGPKNLSPRRPGDRWLLMRFATASGARR